MLLGRTLSDQFSLVWARDPALDVDRLDAEHAEDSTKPNFADAYKRACETQDWAPLLKAGEKATVFRFRLLTGRIGDRVKDMARSGEAGPNEVLGIAFRVALVSIDGWGSPLPKFSRVKDAEYKHLGEMFSLDCYEALCERTGECTKDLGLLVLTRSSDPLPLS